MKKIITSTFLLLSIIGLLAQETPQVLAVLNNELITDSFYNESTGEYYTSTNREIIDDGTGLINEAVLTVLPEYMSDSFYNSDSAESYTASYPQNGDIVLRKWSQTGQLLAQGNFPDDSPTFDIVQESQVTANNGLIFAHGTTYGTIIGGEVVSSESLFMVPSDLQIDQQNDQRLVAFESGFSSLYNDENYVYVLYSAFNPNAKLIINDFDDSEGQTSIIPNPGNGNFFRTWLLVIDVNDITNVIEQIPVGDTSTQVLGSSFQPNSIFNSTDFIELEEGRIAFRYSQLDGIRMNIIQSNSGDTGSSTTLLHTFGPFEFNPHVAECNDRYFVSTHRSISANTIGRISVFNQSFNQIHENYERDYEFGGSPADIVCLSNNEIKIFVNSDGTSGAETTRSSFHTENGVDRGFSGVLGNGVDWQGYFQSYAVNDNDIISFANHQGSAIIFGGAMIPATTEFNMVIYTSTQQLQDSTTFTINDNQPEVLDVYHGMDINPNNSNQLINCGDCPLVVVTLSPGTLATLPADLATSTFLQQMIDVPSGYQLFFANMGTDPFAESDVNRFMKAAIILNGTNFTNADNYIPMRVILTENVYDTGPIDNDGDGVDETVDIDDDNPFICRDLDGDDCDDCSQTGPDGSGGDTANDGIDTDGDGQCNEGDLDDDGDGYSDIDEITCNAHPLDSSNVPDDFDEDFIPDCIDPDDDNDGTLDIDDAFPFDPTEDTDTDGDGIGNNADTDDDGDGYADADENLCGSDPLDESSTPDDLDNDFVPDCVDPDIDGDEVNNDDDAFPFDPNEDTDTDGDGIGNNADTDDDDDGFSDASEINCESDPLDASSIPDDNDGDFIPDCVDPDDDNDGFSDEEELTCGSDPFDPDEDCTTLSIDDVNELNFTIYPNPTSSVIHIETNTQKNLFITLYDIIGKKVMETNDLTFDISDLKDGIYILKLRDSNMSQSFKKIIKN